MQRQLIAHYQQFKDTVNKDLEFISKFTQEPKFTGWIGSRPTVNELRCHDSQEDGRRQLKSDT